MIENPYSILERRLNRIETLILEIKETQEHQAQSATGNKTKKPVKIDRVCQLLGISESTARNWMREGILPYNRKGSRIFFYEEDVLASLEASKKRRA
jgi:excisionase family DNA binding protein